MAAEYEFRTVWRVAGTVDEVRDVLADGPSLPRWWPAVYLSVNTVREGRKRSGRGDRVVHQGLAALHAALDIAGHRADHHDRLCADCFGWPDRERSLEVRAGRSGGCDHLWLAGQREQTAAAQDDLAAETGVRGQPPMGDGSRRAESGFGTAPPPSGYRGGASPCAAATTDDFRLADRSPPRVRGPSRSAPDAPVMPADRVLRSPRARRSTIMAVGPWRDVGPWRESVAAPERTSTSCVSARSGATGSRTRAGDPPAGRATGRAPWSVAVLQEVDVRGEQRETEQEAGEADQLERADPEQLGWQHRVRTR